MPDRQYGLLPPPDNRHLQRYALSLDTMPGAPTPVIAGLPWFASFNQPTYSRGVYYIGTGLPSTWGPLLGGHAVALKPAFEKDTAAWHKFYDQGTTPHCAGYAAARVSTWRNRVRYSGDLIYAKAKEMGDGLPPGTAGTTLRAVCEVLRVHGAPEVRGRRTPLFDAADGIIEYRWATSVDQIKAALGIDAFALRVVNSWGASYPAEVYLPVEAVDYLLNDMWAEFAVPIDKPGR